MKRDTDIIGNNVNDFESRLELPRKAHIEAHKKEFFEKNWVYINYTTDISKSQLESIKETFDDFKVETHKIGIRCGSLDLNPDLQIAFGFGLIQLFGGFFSAMGTTMWEKASKKIAEISKNNGKRNHAIAIIIHIENKFIYAVERFHDENEEIYLKSIPEALLKVDELIQIFDNFKDKEFMQIFQDPITKDWKYLLFPIPVEFGPNVSRIVDLDTFCYVPISDQEFINIFCGDCNGNCCLSCVKHHLKNR